MNQVLSTFGDFCRYSGSVLRRLLPPRCGFRSVANQMHRIGVDSLTVVNLCAFFIGLVLVMQTGELLERFGAKTKVTTILSAAFVREIGPVFAAIMFTGRIGTAIAAEIGSMVVTEQVDAYRSFGSDPVSRIAVPRVLASTLMLPALTVTACVIGIFSGFLIVVFEMGISRTGYLQTALDALNRIDVVACMTKAVVFGLLIGLISTYTGFRVARATEAVGAATTRTMVQGVLAVLVADIVISKLFITIDAWIRAANSG